GQTVSVDGKQSTIDPTFRLWDLEQGKELKKETMQTNLPVICVALSPDGKFAMINDIGGGWLIWDLDERKEPHNGAGGGSGLYSRFAFVPGGTEALVLDGPKVRRLKLAAGKPPAFGPQLPCAAQTRCIGVSADGKLAATAEAEFVKNPQGG